MNDDDLLAHYLDRGSPDARWNHTAKSAGIDFRLKSWFAEFAGTVSAIQICNVGIGAGLWDDFVGYWGAERCQLTSIDIDPRICELLRYRQGREGHPNPARVICADVLTYESDTEFDVVTIVGSTVHEIGDYAHALDSSARLLASGGYLFYADFSFLSSMERFNEVCPRYRLAVAETRRDVALSLYAYWARKQ